MLPNALPNIVFLERFAYLPTGTFGRLVLPDDQFFFTVEKPWRRNARNESCIPEGNYAMALRGSGVVNGSTEGEFSMGWEIVGVPQRSYIMIHPGNWPSDVEGCIAVGQNFGEMPKGGSHYAVLGSRIAFRKMMKALSLYQDWRISITSLKATL